MNNISKLLIASLILLLGGYFAVWWQASEKAEEIINQQINQFLGDMQAFDMQLEYKLQKTGFPFRVGFHVDDIKATVNSSELPKPLVFSWNSDMDITASIFQPEAIKLSYQNTRGQLTGLSDEKGNTAQVDFTIANGQASGFIGSDYDWQESVENIAIQVSVNNIPEKLKLNIGNISSKVTALQPRKNIWNSNWYIEAKDIEFIPSDGENKLEIDSYVIDWRSEFVPEAPELSLALEDIKTTTDNSSQDLTQVKEKLEAYIIALAENNSKLYLNKFLLKTGESSLNISGQFGVNREYAPTIDAKINLKGINKLKEKIRQQGELNQDTQMLLAMAEEDEIEIIINIKNNVLQINGMPVMAITSLAKFVRKIPDIIDGNR